MRNIKYTHHYINWIWCHVHLTASCGCTREGASQREGGSEVSCLRVVTVYCVNWQGRKVASQHGHDTETEGKTQVVVTVEATVYRLQTIDCTVCPSALPVHSSWSLWMWFTQAQDIFHVLFNNIKYVSKHPSPDSLSSQPPPGFLVFILVLLQTN